MKIEPAHREEVSRVAARMRDRDFAELSAVSWSASRDELAKDLADRYGGRPDIMCGWYREEPVCIGGLIEGRPNVLSLLFFATDQFPHIAFPVTRFIKNELFPRMADAGIHRFEAISLASHDQTHRWLRTLGMWQETEPMEAYGKGGEAFIQFVKVIDVR